MFYQQDRENASNLINDAKHPDFLRQLSDTYMRDQMLINLYNFSEPFRKSLLREKFSTWEELVGAIYKITIRLYMLTPIVKTTKRQNLARSHG